MVEMLYPETEQLLGPMQQFANQTAMNYLGTIAPLNNTALNDRFAGIANRCTEIGQGLMGNIAARGLAPNVDSMLSDLEDTVLSAPVLTGLDFPNEAAVLHQLHSHRSTLLHTGLLSEQHKAERSIIETEHRLRRIHDHSKAMELTIVKLGADVAAATASVNIDPLKKKRDEAIAAVERTLIHLDESEDHIDKLVSTLASKAVAGSYKTNAGWERAFAEVLRLLALLLMGSSVYIAYHAIFDAATDKVPVQQPLLRLAFSLILSVPAAYLAREAAKHRQQEAIYKRLTLDLNALPPFTQSLSEVAQHRVREEIALRIFGKTPDSPAGDSFPINTQELLMQAIKVVAEIKASPSKEDKSKT